MGKYPSLEEQLLQAVRASLSAVADEFASRPAAEYTGAEVARSIRATAALTDDSLRESWGLPERTWSDG